MAETNQDGGRRTAGERASGTIVGEAFRSMRAAVEERLRTSGIEAESSDTGRQQLVKYGWEEADLAQCCYHLGGRRWS